MNRTKESDGVEQKMKNVKEKRKLVMIPSIQQLNQIWEYVIERPNKKREVHRTDHQCLFLLCWKAGLRVSEAIAFDLELQHQTPEYRDLYLLRGKGQKERYIYVAPEVVKELRKRNWKPYSATRFTFFEYLKQLQQEVNLPPRTELSPHTLRRCFATHNAINGMPLPVLQKVLGHSKVATTAIYVKGGSLEDLVKYKPLK